MKSFAKRIEEADKTFRILQGRGASYQLPIDYMADHSNYFDITGRFCPGVGYLGIIIIDGKEIYRTGKHYPDLQSAIDQACSVFNEHYKEWT